ncbi:MULTISPECIES: hypothetical protein [unclassified Rhodococcus (in: high G+C Gram-positive bacteria)]|uniref:hypothetical protein n=1 Tax=unclassified Rhodococcus (in: high G+C Gram-positive bacteria) TaxID=192944 RepID=UPI0016396589|nr:MULTISPECIES: hypothetical protein [unclassified Rhodococcus (in: high G+C Gram-positive bacteria)]MBC2639587.1 hypothetical protein [Rhodococcus sp. 3A]MBC2895668.1 hypothetical protein [Rhodococcus sp. 4CII]
MTREGCEVVLREAPSIEPHGSRALSAAADDDVDPAVARRKELRAFLASTPAKLTALGALLVLLTLVAGLVAASTVNGREATLDSVLAETEPLSFSAQNLYSALSVADAAATTAFISGGLEPPELRDTYSQAIGTASADLVYASGGLAASDVDSRRLLASISSELSVYSGLVETARANNRTGHPVGAAYLSEASTLMQTSMLPMAQELHTLQESDVADTQRDYSRPPWFALILVLIALVALVVAQVVLARLSRRTFNLGLMLASACTAILLVWMLVAGLVSSVDTNRALTQGARPMHELTAARILAQQARTEETLKLVRRDSNGDYDAVFEDKSGRLDAVLSNYPQETGAVGRDEVARAQQAWTGWSSAHDRMNEILARGDFVSAAAVAIGPGPADSAAQFTAVDDALTDGIATARDHLRSHVASAARVLTALGSGALVLTLIAFAGIIIGLWPRLREYQ